MEGLKFNRQEVNDQQSAEVSELVTDPERLTEQIALAHETLRRIEEIPEEIAGQLVVRSYDDYLAIEAESKRLNDLLLLIPDAIKLQHKLPSGFHSPEAVKQNRAPQAMTG